MTITKTKNILRVLNPPLLIIGFTLISALKAEIHIDRGSHGQHGKFGFGYASNGTLFGQAITYKNTKTMDTKYFGYEIIIKYLEGEKVTIRFNILYGRNWKNGKAGIYLQDYIPPVCFLNPPPLPLFKLCIRMTQATFFDKHRIQFCFSLHLRILYYFNKDLYTRCMNFTTAPIRSLRSRFARLPTLKKLTEKKKCQTIKRNTLVEGGETADVQESERKDIIIPIN